MLYAVYTPEQQANFKFVDGLIPSLVCILIVFAVLALIAGILAILNHIKALDVKAPAPKAAAPATNNAPARAHVDFESLDDDAKAAVLVATIDYREEVKTDVELVSIKQI